MTYITQRSVFFCFLFVCFLSAASGQTIAIFSGNGQVVAEQFRSTVPLIVQVKSSGGAPLAGVQITWTITKGSGSLVSQTNITDANGQASTDFVATNIQPGYSFVPGTVTAASRFGSANFAITTSLGRLSNGALSAPPLVELLSPPVENRTLSGTAGSTIPGAVVVQVTAQSGVQAGTPVPNVSLRIVNGSDPSGAAPALCNVPTGTVLTDANGRAVCNLQITGSAGFYSLYAIVGEYQNTPYFNLSVAQAPVCTYSISTASQSFSAVAGTGSVNITAGSSCNWTAVSNAPWITINSGASGAGAGSTGFSVAANTGPARAGTLLIAGQTFTVTQSAPISGGVLTITSAATLPVGTINGFYNTTLVATGGQLPYSWSISGAIPPGLSFNSTSGALSGTPTALGTFAFTGTVTDAAGATRSQAFTLVISNQSAGPVITNSGFPGGALGQPYQQALTSTGGCATPFTSASTFRLFSGALPAGLDIKLASAVNYAIAGTPTVPGTFNFALTVSDPCGKSSSSSFTITIAGAVTTLTVNPTSLNFKDTSTQVLAVTGAGGSVGFTATAVSSGNWLSVSPAAANTSAALSVSVNTAGLAASSYNGAITLTTAAGVSTAIPVSLVVTPPAVLDANPKLLTFTHLFGVDVAEPPRPVDVTSSGAPLSFTASADQPWIALSPASGRTPVNVNVSVKPAALSAGSYRGTVQIAPGVSVQVGLTVIAPPPTVTSAATFLPGPVAPGEIVTLFGSNLGPTEPSGLHVTGTTIDTALSGARVLFDGVPSPLIYVSGTQISAIVPYQVAGRFTTQLQVEYNGLRGGSVLLPVVAAEPGIFPNAVLNQDGSLNSRQNGAEPGSIVVFYATGEGQTNPAGVNGKLTLGDTLPQPRLNAGVTIGGQTAQVLYAGAAPGLTAGVIQVNARVPNDVPRGTDAALVLTIGDFTSQSGVTVSIRP